VIPIPGKATRTQTTPFSTEVSPQSFTSVNEEVSSELVNSGIDIQHGRESIALAWRYGPGKSSIVNLLVRLLMTQQIGEVLINGRDIKEYNLKSIHKRLAFVTQRVYIFNDTVAQNVAYGEKLDRDRVISALERLTPWSFVEKLEDGIDTLLSENGNNLSGGERQRIALARALYPEPDLLILDEATSALDNRSELLIQKAIEEIRDRTITISIAHTTQHNRECR